MSTPREKDSWMTSLKELLGDRCSCEVPQSTKTVTLERTESAKRREIQSMPRWGNEPTEQIVRSYSTGSTGPVQRPSLRKRQPDFATVRDDATDVSVTFLHYINFVWKCCTILIKAVGIFATSLGCERKAGFYRP